MKQEIINNLAVNDIIYSDLFIRDFDGNINSSKVFNTQVFKIVYIDKDKQKGHTLLIQADYNAVDKPGKRFKAFIVPTKYLQDGIMNDYRIGSVYLDRYENNTFKTEKARTYAGGNYHALREDVSKFKIYNTPEIDTIPENVICGFYIPGITVPEFLNDKERKDCFLFAKKYNNEILPNKIKNNLLYSKQKFLDNEKHSPTIFTDPNGIVLNPYYELLSPSDYNGTFVMEKDIPKEILDKAPTEAPSVTAEEYFKNIKRDDGLYEQGNGCLSFFPDVKSPRTRKIKSNFENSKFTK